MISYSNLRSRVNHNTVFSLPSFSVFLFCSKFLFRAFQKFSYFSFKTQLGIGCSMVWYSLYKHTLAKSEQRFEEEKADLL
jgi:hypothetical protein